jgi:putative endonuclease
MNKNSYELGILAEKLAIDFLLQNRYSVLQKRYRTPYGEIDIVCRQKDVLVFVEVKKRGSLDESAYSISNTQKKRIFEASQFFIQTHPQFEQMEQRFDAILFGQTRKPLHILNAFWPEDAV